MEAKQKVIAEAYGTSWESLKDVVDENGWNQKRIVDVLELNTLLFDYKATGHGIYISRPKKLKGIENNNGWIKIESEKDMPKEYQFYNACFLYNDKCSIPMFFGLNKETLQQYFEEGIISHYQLIAKPQPPIY